ncbi:MAG: hypothetical protein ACKVQW_00035 [Pyrinomonadaceae bacterium]
MCRTVNKDLGGKMRFKFTYLFPLFFFVLDVLSPFLGPLGTIMPYVGMPLNFIVNDWYIKYGDPTFAAILGGTIQWGIIGLVIDLLVWRSRRRAS